MPDFDASKIVQTQLDAYNRRDLDAWLGTYHVDAEQYELHGPLLARGHAQLRQRMAARLAEPDLHAELISRVVMGQLVVDLERITRNFPEGAGTLQMLCVYEVRGERIARASFATGVRDAMR